ncbi:MAG: response regulator [Gammaproteobacteria bacterium]|nr:response regulator [Gammaproteobacteria bacterium]
MSTPSRCILLADDDQIDTKAFVRALQKLGVERQVLVARDGEQAWDLLQTAPALTPALIVLDINMPRLSGLELLRRMREQDTARGTPVFVLTTSDDESDRLDALELDVAGYIVKSSLAAGLQRALVTAGAWPAGERQS